MGDWPPKKTLPPLPQGTDPKLHQRKSRLILFIAICDDDGECKEKGDFIISDHRSQLVRWFLGGKDQLLRVVEEKQMKVEDEGIKVIDESEVSN